MTKKIMTWVDALTMLLAVAVVATSFFGLWGCSGAHFELGAEEDTGSIEDAYADGNADSEDAPVSFDALDSSTDARIDAVDAIDTASPLDADTAVDSAPADVVDATEAADAVDTKPTTKKIFVSSVVVPPMMGGLAGADAKCQALADAASLGGAYRAWLSDSKTSAKSRLTHASVPYVLVDGTVVASGWSDLVSGALSHSIDRTEQGGSPAAGASGFGTRMVWTATEISGAFHDLSPTGTKTSTCVDWTSSKDPDGGPYASAQVGRWDVSGSAWTDYGTDGCSFGALPTVTKNALYCLEQ